MKIMYIAYFDASVISGVSKKIFDQCRAWSANHEVELLVMTPKKPLKDVSGDGKFKIHFMIYKNRIQQIVLPFFIKTKHIDLIYFRYGTYHPIFEVIFHRLPTIIEFNSNHKLEHHNNLSRLKTLFHSLTRERLNRLAKGFVFVTDELKADFSCKGRPSIVLGNSIDLKRFKILKPVYNASTKAVFIGTPGCEWHGVEVLPRLAEVLKDWEIHIIGYPRDYFDNKPENVIIHGYLDIKDYQTILEQCDVAIASLALYKNNMTEGSTLKLREYLAFGLPCIAGHRDVDFPEQVDYILTVPNTSDGILKDIQAVRRFADAWKGKRVARDSIKHLDTEYKENQRLDFFKYIIGTQQ
ncbi:glycosyltransferase family 4 protein [Deinococcus irradiatisoli]|nr:glycosyltransferase family 4 protein [Deinococcus irradiatisoli]